MRSSHSAISKKDPHNWKQSLLMMRREEKLCNKRNHAVWDRTIRGHPVTILKYDFSSQHNRVKVLLKLDFPFFKTSNFPICFPNFPCFVQGFSNCWWNQLLWVGLDLVSRELNFLNLLPVNWQRKFILKTNLKSYFKKTLANCSSVALFLCYSPVEFSVKIHFFFLMLFLLNYWFFYQVCRNLKKYP